LTIGNWKKAIGNFEIWFNRIAIAAVSDTRDADSSTGAGNKKIKRQDSECARCLLTIHVCVAGLRNSSPLPLTPLRGFITREYHLGYQYVVPTGHAPITHFVNLQFADCRFRQFDDSRLQIAYCPLPIDYLLHAHMGLFPLEFIWATNMLSLRNMRRLPISLICNSRIADFVNFSTRDCKLSIAY